MKNKALKLYTSVLALAFTAACQPTDKASSIEETQQKKRQVLNIFLIQAKHQKQSNWRTTNTKIQF